MSDLKQLKRYIILVIMISIMFGVISLMAYTFDDLFMYRHWEDMLNGNLFRKIDFMTVHNSMPFLHQKWAMCFLTHLIYNIGGFFGWNIAAMILRIGCYIFLGIILYKLNPKYLYPNIYIFIISLFLDGQDATFRPQIISTALVILEVYLLEQFSKSEIKKIKLWIGLFVISLFMMWFHSTMWLLSVITIMPYLVYINWSKFEEQTYNLIDVWVGLGFILLASLFQPNGIYQYKYMFLCATGIEDGFSGSVGELKSFSITDGASLLFLFVVIMFAYTYFVCTKGKKKNIHHILLVGGYFVLAFKSIRMSALASIIAGLILSAELSRSEEEIVDFAFAKANVLTSIKKYIGSVILITFGIVFVSFLVLKGAYITFNPEYNHSYASKYYAKSFIPISTKEYDLAGKKVWSPLTDDSTILEFDGAIMYFDCRAELFSGFNCETDIHEEVYNTISVIANGDYNDVLKEWSFLQNKYDFDYYIIMKEMTKEVPNILSIEEIADKVYENNVVILYKVRK